MSMTASELAEAVAIAKSRKYGRVAPRAEPVNPNPRRAVKAWLSQKILKFDGRFTAGKFPHSGARNAITKLVRDKLVRCWVKGSPGAGRSAVYEVTKAGKEQRINERAQR